MANILLVEDDPLLAKNLQLNLELDGYQIAWARSLREAYALDKALKIDFVILDLNLPDGHGFEFLETLKKRESRPPVIILTAVTDENSVVEGIQRGAKDYMRKPFGYKELLVRMKAILQEPLFRDEQIRFGDILILLDKRIVKYGDKPIELTRKEFDVLVLLIGRAETIVSRQQILEKMDFTGEILDRTIDTHVSNIRSAFKKVGLTAIKISAVYGVGYRLEKS